MSVNDEAPSVVKPEHWPSNSPHVQRNIGRIVALIDKAERAVGRPQRVVEDIASRLGRPLTLVVLLGAIGVWVGVNLVAGLGGWRPFDLPPFPWLQGLLTLASLVMTATVLITQNRQGQLAEQRSQLDLQVNLLSEQKIAKVIELLEELRRDLPSLRNRPDPIAEAMSRSVDPESVVTELERTLAKGDPR